MLTSNKMFLLLPLSIPWTHFKSLKGPMYFDTLGSFGPHHINNIIMYPQHTLNIIFSVGKWKWIQIFLIYNFTLTIIWPKNSFNLKCQWLLGNYAYLGTCERRTSHFQMFYRIMKFSYILNWTLNEVDIMLFLGDV